MSSKRSDTKSLKVTAVFGKSWMARFRIPSRDNAARIEYLGAA
jgi:hypothetical protein